MLDVLRQFKEFLIRLYRWLPVLWKDRDYDYSCLVDLIQFKVGLMAAYHKKRRFMAHWSHMVREMDEFRHLVELHKDDADDEWLEHWNQWHLGSEAKCGSTKACGEALDLSHKREMRNWSAIWNHLDKCAQGWWD